MLPFTVGKIPPYNFLLPVEGLFSGIFTLRQIITDFSSSQRRTQIMPRATKSKARSSLVDLTPPSRKKRPESLTSREQEILELIWAGFKNKEIGQRLKISVKTVEAHRANMMKKMRVSNTAQLLKTAIHGGMLRIR
jgi:DNA-binding NarL/FixJ family response regulator